MNQSSDVKAKLGCGSIILIGIVVAMFAKAGVEDLESEVLELRETVELQTSEIRDLGRRIDSLISLGSR